MLSCKRLFTFSFFILFIFSINNQTFCQNYVFAQLSGIPVNTTGWTFQGDARPNNFTGSTGAELLLCPAVFNSSGALFYNQPINLSMCSKWIAEFDFRMYDGTGADGLAFCFLDVPPAGFVNGGGLGIPDNANGLKVCFDTWNNCIPFDPNTVHQDMPKIEIRWGIGYDNNSDPNNLIYGECENGPTRDNSDGKISFIRSPNYNHAMITYDSGNIKVYVNDTLYLTGYQTFNFTGYLGFTASTGGYTDMHTIKNVVIYTQMPPSFAGNSQSFCPYDTIQIGGPANPNYLYSWHPSSGLTDTTVSAPYLHLPNDSSNSIYYKYYVKTSFSNNPGCASTDSVILKVYPDPKVHFITPEICLTDAIAQFYDSTYTGDSTTMPFTYQWNFGDPNANAGNPNSSILKDPTHHYSAASHYPLTLAVTNSQGCEDSLSKIFTVNGAVPKAAFSENSVPSLCSNQSIGIMNESSVDFGSITRVKIYWGDSSLVSYTDSQPYPGKQYFHNYPNPISTTPSTYTIRMISSSGITCEDENDQQITIQPSPHVQFSPIPSLCVYDSPILITQATELTNLPGVFTFTGKGISPEGLFTPQLAGPGTFELLYKNTSTNGCTDSAYQNITVYAPPVVSAGSDTSVVINQPLQLQALSSDAIFDTFLWSPSTGLNDPGIANPVAILNSTIDSIRYTVMVTDTTGCFADASIAVKVFKTSPNIFVPNAFTPGKATNSIFKPIPVGISSIQYFRIYNRWGQMVYSTSHMGEGWDGIIGGKIQETDSFVWVVEGTTYTGVKIFKKGTMTLIR
jgi:Bacterial lectin/PKD domain/CHU_C Type IX secretion signal domain